MTFCQRSPYVLVQLAALGVVVVPAVAFAQPPACGPGQLVVDNAGHCCSPGQGWDAASGQCANTTTIAPGPTPVAGQPPPPPTPPPAPTTMMPTGIPGLPVVPMTPGGTTNLVVSRAPFGDPTAPVPVTFAPEQPGDNETLVIQPVGGAPVSCSVPCVVNLAPGYVTITGSGQRDFQTGLNVPPLAPLTVQVNHLTSAAPGLVIGSLLLAGSVAATIGSVASFVAAGQSCATDPMTAAETAAQSSCQSTNTTHTIVGALLIPVAVLSLISGLGVTIVAANHGTHPITIMNPGDISSRPLTQAEPAIRFTGIEPSFVQGGGLLRGGFVF